jgi:protease I
MVKVLMIIAQYGFRDEELYDSLEIFESAGYKVDIASQSTEEAKGMLGAIVKPNTTFKDAKAYDYDAVVVVGGRGSMSLADNADVLRIVRDAYDRQKVVGAICLGPMVLAKAGLLKGKKATVSLSQDSMRLFKQLGIELLNDDVVVAGSVITANGPLATKKFAKRISEKILG